MLGLGGAGGAKIASAYVELSTQASMFKKGITDAKNEWGSFGSFMQRQGTTFIKTGALMVAATAGIGLASVKMAADFDKNMRNVNSISKLSETQFKQLGKQVVDLSRELPQSAETLAAGLYDIASSGFQGAEGMEVLDAAARAASAGITTTAVAAKGITAVLNAYGLEADEAGAISDTMFKTVDKGVITFEELSSQIGDVVGTAKLAGINFNELSGAVAYMTTKGINGAEAMTSMNRLILSIIDPSAELAKVLKDAGYESGEAALKQLGLAGVLKLMDTAAGGSLTTLQKLSPEMRALKASGALLGNGIQDLDNYMKDFKDTTGATSIALAEQSKSLYFQLDILKNNIKAVGIAIGTDLMPSLVSATTDMSKWIANNQDATVSMVKFTAGAMGMIGTLAILGGLAPKVWTGMLLIGKALSPLIPMLANLMPALTIGTLGTAAGVIGAVGVAAVQTGDSINYLYDKTENYKTSIMELNNRVREWELTQKDGTDSSIKLGAALNDVFQQAKAETISMEEANVKMNELLGTTKELTTANEAATVKTSDYLYQVTALKTAQHEGREITIEQIIAGKDYEAALASLMTQYGLTREQAIEYYASNREGAESIDTLAEAASGAQEEVKSLVTELYKLFNINQSVTELTWEVDEALKEYEKTQGSVTKTVGGSEEQQLAYMKAQQKTAEATENYNKILAESPDNVMAVTEAHVALTNAQAAEAEAATNATATTKTYTASTEEQEKALFKAQDALEGLQLKLEESIVAGDLSTESTYKMQRAFMEAGDKAVALGVTTKTEFLIMAENLGINTDKMSTGLANLSNSAENAGGKVKSLREFINSLQSKEVTITTNYVNTGSPDLRSFIDANRKAGIGRSGGYVTDDGIKRYAGGGITPFNIPQIPAMLHPNELILNPVQGQRLLFEIAKGNKELGSGRAGSQVTVNLTYNGSESRQDVYAMVDIIEAEIKKREDSRV